MSVPSAGVLAEPHLRYPGRQVVYWSMVDLCSVAPGAVTGLAVLRAARSVNRWPELSRLASPRQTLEPAHPSLRLPFS